MKRPPKRFWLPGAASLIFALMGLIMLLWPAQVLAIMVPLLGTVLILVGIQGLAYGFVMYKKLPDPTLRMVQGGVNLVVGLVFLVKQDVSSLFLSVLFGLYVLVSAVAGLSLALSQAREKQPWLLDLLLNSLDLVLGVVLLVAPFTTQVLWVRVLGVHFILSAIDMLRQLDRKP